MKLYFSKTSPYSRKVRLVLLEKGLMSQVEMIEINPFTELDLIRSINPLAKIPALITDTGEVFFDSPVICQYIDQLSDENRLIPSNKDAYWQVMRWQALADGIIDAAYNIVMERRRNPEQQSSDWINQWIDEIANALKAIENNISEVEGDVTLANIAIASAIGYLDFRLPEILHNNSAVLNAHPQLALWYSKFEKRSSMVSTKPQ